MHLRTNVSAIKHSVQEVTKALQLPCKGLNPPVRQIVENMEKIEQEITAFRAAQHIKLQELSHEVSLYVCHQEDRQDQSLVLDSPQHTQTQTQCCLRSQRLLAASAMELEYV